MLFSSLAESLEPRIFLAADTGDSGASGIDATQDTTSDDDSFGAGIDEAAAALESSSGSSEPGETEGEASSPGTLHDRASAEGSAQPTAAQQQAFSALEYARSQGVDFGYQNDQEFTRDAVAAIQMLRQRQGDLQLAQQIRPYLPQFQQFMAAQQQPQKAAETVAEKKRWIEALENDPSLYRMVETDPETGSLRAKAGYDPGVVAKIMNNQNQMQVRAEQLLADPAKFLEPMQQETIAQAVAQAVQQVEEKYFNTVNANMQARDIVDRSSSWMFTPDRSGYTPLGVRYIQILQNLDSVGVRDPRQADELARNMLQQEQMHYSQYGQAPQQMIGGGQPQQATPARQAQNAKANFVKNGQRTPNVGTKARKLGDDTEGLSLAEMSARAYAAATAN